MITQAELKRLLHYNPDTGIFTWINLNPKSYSVKVGDVAGSINGTRYIDIGINGKIYKSHRLAWLYVYGEWPRNDTDHINHKRDDNRINNLRCATRKENSQNQRLASNNTSGVIGVYWHSSKEKWVARIYVNSKNLHQGYFIDKFEAICARKSAEIKYGFHENHGAL